MLVSLLFFTKTVSLNAASSGEATWPDAASTSTSGSTVTVCMGSGQTCDFTITLQVENDCGTTSDVWVFIKDGLGSYQRFILNSVPDDNAVHNYNVDLDGLIRIKGGIYSFEAVFLANSSSVNSTKTYVLANDKIQLFLNGQRDVDGIVETSSTSSGCAGLTLKANQYTCSSSLALTWVLSVNKATIGTYATIPFTTYSATLSAGDVFALKNGTFNLKTWYSGLGGTWTDNTLYNVYMVASGGGVWADAAIWLSNKTSQETYVRDYADFVSSGFSQSSRYLAYAENDLGFEQNRYEDVKVPNCVEHRISLYESPDLWNTYSSSSYSNTFFPYGLTDHRNPDYIIPGSSNANYAYTTVNNRQCPNLASGDVTVRMFWTGARTGEKWPQDWLYDLTRNKVKSAEAPYPDVPAGSEITLSGTTSSSPYNTTSSPVSLSAISGPSGGVPGAKVTAGVAWYPPKPDWYDVTNGSMTGHSKPVICMLTRVNENNSGSDPIIYGVSASSMSNTDIDPYIRWNNNVATRNTELVNELNPLVATDQGGGIWEGDFHTAIVNNPTGNAIRICLRDLNLGYTAHEPFDRYGELHIGFTNALYNNWFANGAQGSGFEILSSTLVRVTDYDKVCFDSITLGDSLSQQIGVRAVYYEDSLPAADTITCRYALYQENMPGFTSYRGSDIIYHWHVMPAEEAAMMRNNESGEKMSYKDRTDMLYKKSVQSRSNLKTPTTPYNLDDNLLIFPNPSHDFVDITLSNHMEAEVTLTDALGKIVKRQRMDMHKSNALYKRLNLLGLSPGVYTITVKSGSQSITKNLIKQ